MLVVDVTRDLTPSVKGINMCQKIAKTCYILFGLFFVIGKIVAGAGVFLFMIVGLVRGVQALGIQLQVANPWLSRFIAEFFVQVAFGLSAVLFSLLIWLCAYMNQHGALEPLKQLLRDKWMRLPAALILGGAVTLGFYDAGLATELGVALTGVLFFMAFVGNLLDETERQALEAASAQAVAEVEAQRAQHSAFSAKHVENVLSPGMRRFEARNAVPADKRRLLAFGAVLNTSNSESSRVLALRHTHPDDLLFIQQQMAQQWHVWDMDTAVQALQDLATTTSYIENLNEQLRCILASDGIDNPVFRKAYDCLLRLKYTPDEILSITTVAAWNHGRAGIIAKYAYQLGYLTESQVWEHLQAVANDSARTYTDFRSFLAAYILGCALGYPDDDLKWWHPIFKFLLQDKKSPWQEVSFNAYT